MNVDPDNPSSPEKESNNTVFQAIPMDVEVALCCSSCDHKLASTQDICFYFQNNRSLHLTVKYECMEGLRSSFNIIPQINPKRAKFSPFVLNCKFCGNQVGMEAIIGHNREYVFCFPPISVYINNPHTGKYQKNWADMMPIIKEIETRSQENFYGTLITLDSTFSSKLQAMPKIETVYAMLGNVASDAIKVFMNLPLGFKPRTYQLECFCSAITQNSIIYLPTGAGKTLVSALIMAYMKHLNPQKLLLFLVDRVPLVFQQGEYLRENLGLSILMACGELNCNAGERELYSYDGICCTAQLLLNFLQRKIIRIEDICCIVMDEIHHAAKKHPYALLLKNHINAIPKHYQPLLIGLTASPAVGNRIEMAACLDSLCSSMGNATIHTPIFYRDEMDFHVNRPQMGFIEVLTTLDDNRLQSLLLTHVNLVIKKLYRLMHIEIDSFTILTNEDITQLRSIVKKLTASAHSRKNDIAIQTGNYLQQILSSFEMISILGCNYAKKYLMELLQRPNNCGLWTHDEFSKLEGFITDLKGFKITDESGKARYLLKLLKYDVKMHSEYSRTIIFVQTKKTARWLCELLRDDLEIFQKFNPMYFIGQGDKNSLDGMSWMDQQEPILAAFREGSIKLLISTSVLQEGLDVPSCDNIILFDRTWSLTNFVQSRGRARSKNSRYILICSNQEVSFYKDLIRSEHDILHIIMDILSRQPLTSRIGLSSINLCKLVEKNWKKNSAVLLKEGKHKVKITLRNLPKDWIEEEMSQNVLTHLQNSFDMDSDEIHFTKLDGLFCGSTLEASININSIPTFLNTCRKALNLQIFENSLIQATFKDLSKTANEEAFFFNALAIGFGCLVTPVNFGQYKELVSLIVKVEINVLLNKFEITFKKEDRIYRVRIDVHNIDHFLILGLTELEMDLSLLIPLKRPPMIMFIDLKNPALSLENALLDSENLNWKHGSAVEFVKICDEIGSINTIKLSFVINHQTKNLLVGALERLSVAGLYSFIGIVKNSELNINFEIPSAFPFDSLYSVLALRSTCFTSFIGRVDASIIEKIFQLNPEDINTLALKMQNNRFYDWNREVDLLAEDSKKIKKSSNKKESNFSNRTVALDNTCYLKMVIITPSRIIYLQPKPMARNRITRAFPDQHFIRVQFRDDSLFKLSKISVDSELTCILSRIKHFLDIGFMIGEKSFDFLAMSSSQLRDHGCWFVTPFSDPKTNQLMNADLIRAWMGDFSSIKNVAKYVARLGQSLSASMGTVAITNDSSFIIIPDIVNEQKANFSDGIGMISRDLAVYSATKLNLEYQPCAFQIRFAGFKGVVAIDPNPTSGIDLKFRPSMRKFESMHRKLEILNIATYIPCYLNRQIIMILSGLGVKDENFDSLHDEMLLNMAVMLLDTEVSKKQLAQNYHCYPKIEFKIPGSVRVEPFFRSIIMAIYRKQLDGLLTRSRIFVKNGRVLLGTIDETGTLNEDEVFIQCRIQKDEKLDSERTRIKGNNFIVISHIVIAKNPCMHPGDVRVLKAVYNPILADCRWDVIVFPAKGLRPITDMCSGSDLDGDLYFVTWDPKLLAPSVDEPLSYQALDEKISFKPVDVEDMRKFMVDFIENDQLGSIANAHVAHVDLKPLGVRDPICKELARIFSLAVDFPKTGYLAKLPDDAKVENWPDFMNKPAKLIYQSKKIIGKMYRKAKFAFNNDLEKVLFPIEPNELLLKKGREKYVDYMNPLYEEYCQEVSQLLALYGISDETQVLSGCLNELDCVGKDDMKGTLEILGAKLQSIQKRFRVTILKLSNDEEQREMIASAAYFCCYSNPKSTFSGRPILSFPWILGDYLEKITTDDFVMTKDICSILNDQVNLWLKEPGLISEHLSEYLDRIRVFDMVHDLIKSEPDITMLIGSTPLFAFGEFSDINIATTRSLSVIKSNLKEFKIISKPKDTFLINYQIEEYQVSILYGQTFEYFKSIEQNEKWMHSFLIRMWPTVEMLKKWATCFRITRHGPFHYGKIPTWRLLTFLFRFSEYTGLFNNSSSVVDSIDWKQTVSKIKSTKGQMMILIRFFQFLSFSPTTQLLECFGIDTNEDDNNNKFITLPYLREAAIRSFHLLSQTLDIRQLWLNSFLVDDVEVVAALDIRHKNKMPQIMRKHGLSSGGFFAQGCSRILFDYSTSRVNKLWFELYNGRRRFPHLEKHCYSPRISLPDDKLNVFCRSEFFNHFQKQLLAVHKIGNDSFGDLKMHIKLGNSYIMNLPKMFIEEITSPTLNTFQDALDKSYKKFDVDLKRIYAADSDAKLSSAPRIEISRVMKKRHCPDEIDNKENKGDNPADADENSGSKTIIGNFTEESSSNVRTTLKNNDLIKMLGGVKIKTNSVMNSAFEPHLDPSHYARLCEFLTQFEFTLDEEKNSANRYYSLSIALFDENDGGTKDYQIKYNSELQVQQTRLKPLKWFICDIKSTTSNKMDLRFNLRSSKSLNLDKSIFPPDLINLVIDERGQQHPQIGETYRYDSEGSLKLVFVRSSITQVYKPSERTSQLLNAHFTQLEGVDPSSHFYKSIRIYVDHVAEWVDLNPGGHFNHKTEKMEIDCHVPVKWDQVGDAGEVDSLIRNSWTFACMLKSFINY